METGPTALNNLAEQELSAATEAITGGDEIAARWARDIRQRVDAVNAASRRALDTAARLHNDDVSNPAGVARQLGELPGKLVSETAGALEQAELTLGLLEDLHYGAILKHDGRNDGALREELRNYTMNLKPEKATATMVQLASNPRYATILAGPMGASLAARFGFDASVLERTALQALATDGIGSPDQVARSRALASIGAMRRVLGLAKGGRDAAVDEVKRPPKPAPTQAMFR